MVEKIGFDNLISLLEKFKTDSAETNKLLLANSSSNNTIIESSKNQKNNNQKNENSYLQLELKDDDFMSKMANPEITLPILASDSNKNDISETYTKTVNLTDKEAEAKNTSLSDKETEIKSASIPSKEAETNTVGLASNKEEKSVTDNESKPQEAATNNSDTNKTDKNIYTNLDEFKNLFSDNKMLNEVLDKYGYEKLFNAVDTDSDGTVSKEEIGEFNKTLDLEKLAGFSDDEVKALAEKLGIEIDNKESDNGPSTDELKKIIADKLKGTNNQANPAQTAAAPAAARTSTPTSSSGGGGSYGGYSGGGSSGSSGSSIKKEEGLKGMSLEELEKEKTKREGKVDDANNDIKAVNDGSNEKVQAAKKDADEKKEAYDKALEKDDKVSKELKEKQKKNTENITKKEEVIGKLENDVVDDKTKVKEAEAKIESVKSHIEALKAAQSSLPEKTEKNKDKWSDIDAKASEIKTELDKAEKEKTNAEKEKKEAETKQKKDEEKVKEEKKVLARLENERKAIEKEIQENCSKETKEALEAWQTARDNIDKVKSDEMKTAEGNLSDAQKGLDEVNEVINNKEAAKTAIEYGMNGRGEEIVEFAMKFNGLGESDMYQYMDVLNSGQWCADFVTFVTKNIYGNDVPGNLLEECTNLSTCYGYGTWAQSHGILMDARCTEYDRSQVQPGDYILFNTDGGEWRHIGIVASVDPDGTVHTIEGNTGGGEVGGRTVDANDTDVSFVLMNKLK